MTETRLFLNGRFYLGEPGRYAEALACVDGRIAALGNCAEIEAAFPSASTKIDLAGKTIWPGLTDSHLHLLLLGQRLSAIDCDAPSKAEMLRKVAARAEALKDDSWLVGFGWNQNSWTPPQYGTAAELDAFSGSHPVILYARSLHAAWVNSAALAQAGITPATPDPAGGTIQRDAAGRPSGILLENAISMVEGAIPPAVPDQIEDYLLRAQLHLLSLGITCVHDFDRWEHLDTLFRLEASGQLKLKVFKSLPAESLDRILRENLRQVLEARTLLRPGWVKAFADGALGPQTAAMLQPYEGTQERGLLQLRARDVFDLGIHAAQGGWPLAVHAIGDAANREVLKGFALLRQYEAENRLPHLPHRVEHAQIVAPEDLDEFARLDVTASVQPIHATSDMETADRHWGSRCVHAYPYGALGNHSARLIFGSDAPVESANPFCGIHAAVSRRRQDGAPGAAGWQPAQKVSLAQAFQAYTRQPSGALDPAFLEGSFRLGRAADMILLPEDPYRMDSNDIWTLKPSATIIAGEMVYSDEHA